MERTGRQRLGVFDGEDARLLRGHRDDDGGEFDRDGVRSIVFNAAEVPSGGLFGGKAERKSEPIIGGNSTDLRRSSADAAAARSHHDLAAIGGQRRAGDQAGIVGGRKRTQRATSSGSPSRPIGISGSTDFSSTSFGIACTMSVLM